MELEAHRGSEAGGDNNSSKCCHQDRLINPGLMADMGTTRPTTIGYFVQSHGDTRLNSSKLLCPCHFKLITT
uniref:Uncharacterized protein n=1 Tax=Glossina morsitans morsitans TaxID=37546 RepID=A0A1B0G2R7_GLOMM